MHLSIDADFEAVLRAGQRADAVQRHGARLALGRRAKQLARLLLLLLRRRQLPRQVAVVVRLHQALVSTLPSSLFGSCPGNKEYMQTKINMSANLPDRIYSCCFDSARSANAQNANAN